MLLWTWRAPSPYLFLLGIVGPSLKGFMLAIDITSTYRFLCCTLDQCFLVKSARRSAGSRRLILALLILLRISCLYHEDLSLWHIPQLWYYPGHIGKCTHSHFYGVEELFSWSRWVQPSMQKGLDHMDLDRKDRYFTVILSRPFHFAILLLFFKAFSWSSRWIWSIVCKSPFLIFI